MRSALRGLSFFFLSSKMDTLEPLQQEDFSPPINEIPFRPEIYSPWVMRCCPPLSPPPLVKMDPPLTPRGHDSEATVFLPPFFFPPPNRETGRCFPPSPFRPAGREVRQWNGRRLLFSPFAGWGKRPPPLFFLGPPSEKESPPRSGRQPPFFFSLFSFKGRKGVHYFSLPLSPGGG